MHLILKIKHTIFKILTRMQHNHIQNPDTEFASPEAYRKNNTGKLPIINK